MVKNILPKGVECIFVRQSEQLGLGHAVLCAERVVGNETFAVLLADDFLAFEGNGAMSDHVSGYKKSGKSQLCVTKVNGPSISNYGVIVPNKEAGSIAGLVEKPKAENAPSNIASIGRNILTPDIFTILRNQKVVIGNEIQLADAINTQALSHNVETVLLNGKRFDCGNKKDYINAIKYVSNNYKFE